LGLRQVGPTQQLEHLVLLEQIQLRQSNYGKRYTI
jgi:hypothetical protein